MAGGRGLVHVHRPRPPDIAGPAGVALGTALVFVMAVTALSIPEMILLRTVLKPRLLAVFVGVVGTGIVLVWYRVNGIIR